MSEASCTGRLKSSTSIASTWPESTGSQFHGSWIKSPVTICSRAS